MICNAPIARGDGARELVETEGRDYLGDITGKGGDPRRLFRIGRILAQREAVVLDCRAATRGIDHDGVEPGGEALARPRIDVGPRETKSSSLPPEMMDERTAATAALRHHDLATMTGQKPDCRLVDLGSQHPLGAAKQKGYLHAPLAFGREEAQSVRWEAAGTVPGASANIGASLPDKNRAKDLARTADRSENRNRNYRDRTVPSSHRSARSLPGRR